MYCSSFFTAVFTALGRLIVKRRKSCTVETYKSLQGKSLQNFKSLRFLVIFPIIFGDFKKIILNRYGFF